MNRTAWAGALLLLTCAGAAAAAEPETAYFSLSIGVNEPPTPTEDGARRRLRFADDDAVRFHRFFEGLTERSWLLTLLDSETQRQYPGLSEAALPPSPVELERALSSLQRAMAAARASGRRTVLYWTYSGHGQIGPDAEPALTLLGGRLDRRGLAKALERMPADYIHLFIDACHAGALVGVRGGRDDPFAHQVSAAVEPVSRAEALDLDADRLTERLPGLGVLLASSADQEAHEWVRFRAGVFSHELLSSLAGPADVNADRRIEYSEIHAFVTAANRGVRDPRAAPRIIAIAPRRNRNVAVVDLARLRGVHLLTGDPRGLGHFFIELASGQRYLDANLDETPRVAIALPDRTRAFLRTADREADLPAGGGRLADLEFTDRSRQERGSLDETYRRSLFTAPYGRTYYMGFVDRTGTVGVRFFEPLELSRAAPEESWRRPLALTSLALAGASLLGCVVTGALALDARADFDQTGIEQDAHVASRRYADYGTAALVTGAGAAAFGLLGWLLWPAEVEAGAGPGVGLAAGAPLATYTWTW